MTRDVGVDSASRDAAAVGDADGPDGSVLSGQYPIQVILNVHNHSMASLGGGGATNTDVEALHCMVREWLQTADGWLRLATLTEPAALADIKFSFMLDGHWTAWNSYHLANHTAGGDFCATPADYVSPFILDTDATGAAIANAGIDFGAFLAAGHMFGHHTHCHELAVDASLPEGYPPELFWTDLGRACDRDVATGTRVLGEVQTQIETALSRAGTDYTPTSLHQTMGTLDWRIAHGYKNFDSGYEALRLRNVAHPLWNPHRPCCVATADQSERCGLADTSYAGLLEAGSRPECDPDAALLLGIPELAQAGEVAHARTPTSPSELFYERVAANPRFKYGTNNELPQMKKYFWMIYHERRVWELLGLPPRVWTLGFAMHDSRVSASSLRYDSGYYAGAFHEYDVDVEVPSEGVLPQFYGWVAANFVGPVARTDRAAEFATFDDVQVRFEDWEAAAGGAPSAGQRGFEGTDADYIYELRWNRLIGPANVRLASEPTPGGRPTLVYDVHDPAVYDMTACGEDGSVYSYGRDATGAATRRPECSTLGDVVDRYVLVWSREVSEAAVDARALCGSFAMCADPYVPVLAYDQDDPAAGTSELASSIAPSELPRLVMCAAACCGDRTACGDAGWRP